MRITAAICTKWPKTYYMQPNRALLTDAYSSLLRAQRGAAKRGR